MTTTYSLPSRSFRPGPAGEFVAGLRRLLARCFTPGEASLDPTADVRRVRAYALSLWDSDPRMATDLLAAADRHERMHGL
jgi:hypothetical protein